MTGLKSKFVLYLFALPVISGALLFSPMRGFAADQPVKPEDVLRQSIDSAVATVKPALVRIHVVSAEYEEGREVKRESSGSGAIISADGYVITNHHVAGKAKHIVCTLADKTEVEADLIGTDPLSDIAVIKLRGAGRKFPFAEFEDSSSLAVGDYILAMGSPLALSQSVTRGIVSNTEMIMPDMLGPDTMTLDGEDVGSIVRWIGHDAQIFPGNSGGPLVNIHSKIVGINEISYGLSGAIPSNIAKPVAKQLIANGRVVRSWIGLELQPMLRSGARISGALVSGSVDGSPADKAGFLAGDILMRLDGKEVVARFQEQMPMLNQMIATLPVGKEFDALVLRNGKETPLKVTTRERQSVEARPVELKEWGLCASDISPYTAMEMKRKDTVGVLVQSVRPGGPSNEAKPGLSEDDVITSIAGKPVNGLADLATQTAAIVKAQTEPVATLVGFTRNNKQYLTVVKVGIRDMQDPGLEAKKAWLPVETQPITEDLANALMCCGKTGCRITSVYPNTAAEKANLKVGDLIVALDGEEIPASQPEDTEVLSSMIRKYKIGATATLTVLRGKQELKIPVTLPESPKLVREMKKFRDEDFEFTCRDVAYMDRAQAGWKSAQQGVLVVEVGEGGWAALGRLQPGDLLVSIGGKPVANLLSFQSLMKQVAAAKANSVTLQVLRGIHELYVELQTTWDSPVKSKVASVLSKTPAKTN